MSYEPRHYTARLMVGIAERISAAGLAYYDPEHNPYPRDVRGIYFDHSPPGVEGTSQKTCVITPYLPQSGELAIEHTSVQIRARHVGMGALEIRDWLDDIRALFPDQQVHVIGGLIFDRVRQTGSTSWGEPTKVGAIETTQNFRFRGNRFD